MTTNKNITDEELLRDIENTRNEMYAYSYLHKGFTALSNLPEADDIDKKLFYNESVKYFKKQNECLEFLRMLNSMKIERGIGLPYGLL